MNVTGLNVESCLKQTLYEAAALGTLQTKRNEEKGHAIDNFFREDQGFSVKTLKSADWHINNNDILISSSSALWTANMSICDSEENRKKLAWLVPGYILLAWFFCVLFQPLGIHQNSRYHPRLTKYGEQVIYLAQDEADPRHCQNNGSIITLEEGQTSAVVLRLGRVHHNRDPFVCRLKVRRGHR